MQDEKNSNSTYQNVYPKLDLNTSQGNSRRNSLNEIDVEGIFGDLTQNKIHKENRFQQLSDNLNQKLSNINTKINSLETKFKSQNLNQRVPKTNQTQTNPNTMANIKPEILFAIQNFTGDDEKYTVDDFIDQVSDYSVVGNWSDDTTCRIAKRKMTGRAGNVMRTETEFKNANTWPDLQKLLRERFQPILSTQQAQFNFSSCKQMPDESVDKYADRFSSAALKAIQQGKDPSQSQALLAKHEENKLQFFINGLRPDLKYYVKFSHPTTFTEALKKAREGEPNSQTGDFLQFAKANANPEITTKLDNILGALSNLEARQSNLEARSGQTQALNFPNFPTAEINALIKRNNPSSTKDEKKEEASEKMINELTKSISEAFAKLTINTNRPNRSRYDKFTNYACYYCGKNGHVMRACRTRQYDEKRKNNSNDSPPRKTQKKSEEGDLN